MALICKLLSEASGENVSVAAGQASALRCHNPACITTCEQELVHLSKCADGINRCVYCDAEMK
jgi:aspartate carbamoyltransferase regulatory subunit